MTKDAKGVLICQRKLQHADVSHPSKQCLIGVLGIWLACASPVTILAQERKPRNWTSTDAPCVKYDDLRNDVLDNVGVKIDATDAWADAFRRALSFWNTVLAANFHEETSLSACAIKVMNGSPHILNKAIVARSQLIEWDNFRGQIAVSPAAAKALGSAAMYGTAVHEIGHMLGLKHSLSNHSVMYILNIDGTEGLDSKDLLDLSACHKLRPTVISSGFLPIQGVLVSMPPPETQRLHQRSGTE
jgi:Matrixin